MASLTSDQGPKNVSLTYLSVVTSQQNVESVAGQMCEQGKAVLVENRSHINLAKKQHQIHERRKLDHKVFVH